MNSKYEDLSIPNIDSIETITLRSLSLSSNESLHKVPIKVIKKKRRIRDNKKKISESPKISHVLKYLSFINNDK